MLSAAVWCGETNASPEVDVKVRYSLQDSSHVEGDTVSQGNQSLAI
jgi:hypothetical protein